MTANRVRFGATQDARFAFCSTLPAHLRPTPLDRAEAQERIEAHLPTYARLRHDARYAHHDVARWTLPAAWNPSPHIDQADPHPEARLYGAPVTFTGDRIVCHWTDGTAHTADPDHEPPRV